MSSATSTFPFLCLEQNSDDRFRNKRCSVETILKIILLLSFLFNVVGLSIIVIKLVWNNSDEKQVSNTYNLTGPVCFECDTAFSSLSLFEDIYAEEEDNLCCIKDQSFLKDLILLFVRKEVEQREGSEGELEHSEGNLEKKVYRQLGWWRNREHSAHLYLNKIALQDLVFQWDTLDTFGTSFTSKTVKLVGNNSRISVPKSGIYFVYSSINVDFVEDSPIPIVYHSISRQHPLLPETGSQMMLMRKYGGFTPGDRRYNSFLCASLQLRRGDEISSYFSDPRYIDRYSSLSYFGIFKL